MVNKYKCYKFFILILIVNTLISCSQKVLLYKGDSLPPDKIAIISGDDGLLEVQEIDKEQQLIMLRPGVEIHLLPGFHRIKINVRPFQDPNGRIIYSKHYKIIEFNALAGYKYKIKYLGEGDWNNGGTWSAQLSCIYPNELNSQKPVTGKSEISFKDGTKYIGETSNGVPNGYGKAIWPDGAKYEGQFKDGKKEGTGIYLKKNGVKFEGNFINGQLNGDGTVVYPDGLTYKGNFKNGIPHGSGTMTYPNTTEFIGTFNNGDKINGKFIIPAKANIDDYLKDGFTALLIAVSMGDIQLVKNLINTGADINIPNQKDQFTPLSRSIANGHTEIAKYLLKNGANINLKTNFQESPLMIAVRKQNIEIVKFILNGELDINENSLDVIENLELLLKRGININERRRDGSTALLLAVQNEDKEMVTLLLKYGASPIIKDSKGRSPFSIAKDNKEIYNLLRLSSVKLLQGVSEMLIPVDKIKSLKIPSKK